MNDPFAKHFGEKRGLGLPPRGLPSFDSPKGKTPRIFVICPNGAIGQTYCKEHGIKPYSRHTRIITPWNQQFRGRFTEEDEIHVTGLHLMSHAHRGEFYSSLMPSFIGTKIPKHVLEGFSI